MTTKRGEKRGQVTIFIILGLIIILGIILFFSIPYLYKIPAAERIDLSAIKQALTIGIEKCLEREIKNGAELLSLQSGYLTMPDSVLVVGETPFPYGLEGTTKTILNRPNVENNLAAYLALALPKCIGEGKFQGVTIKKGTVSPKVIIADETITVQLTYPMTLSAGGKEEVISTFQAKVPLRLGYVHATVDEFLTKLQAEPDWIDMTYLSQHPLHIVIYPATTEGYLLTVEDSESKVPGGNLTFITAVKFP